MNIFMGRRTRMIIEYLYHTFVILIFALLFLPKLNNTKDTHRHIVIFIMSIFSIRYLAWRLVMTVWPADFFTIEGAWVWFCFIIELMIWTESAIFFLTMYKQTNRIPEADKYEIALRHLDPATLPDVDILIPSYNEPIDVLERTIQGALHIDWPKDKLHVWVLDDGRREWLKDYCEEKGAGYMTRPNNLHAKAGNINNGIEKTSSPFFAIFDADFVPFRSFLYRTLGFFGDPKVGVLQTPQHFFNKDFLQTNLHLHSSAPDEQRVFFDVIMPSRDGWDAAFWCGSCSLTRRSALAETGGVPHESITEDILMTMELLRHGYVTRYLCEKLSHGLAAESMNSLMIQRERWCRGNIQLLFMKAGPLGPNLSLVHRIIFLPIYWIFNPISRLMSFLIPMIYLWTGIPALVIPHFIYLVDYQLPFITLNFFVVYWFTPKHFVPILSTAKLSLSSIQILPTVIHSLIKPFSKGFAVTPKGKDANQGGRIHWYSFGISAFLFVGTFVGILINIDPDAPTKNSSAFFPIAAYWAIVNLIMSGLMMLISIEHPRFRTDERFDINKRFRIRFGDSTDDFLVKDISMGGISFDCQCVLFKKNEQIFVCLEDVGEVPAHVLSTRKQWVHVQFNPLDEEMRDKLIRHIYTGRYDNGVKLESLGKLAKDLFHRSFGKLDHLYKK